MHYLNSSHLNLTVIALFYIYKITTTASFYVYNNDYTIMLFP
jgi:hypothetical protein